ncbi:hypothetical protein H5410_045513 [Solanum commersonii]|uniref:Uncharacterized protein n=1 Tax=Solanum commersonii TaxID=4109 RepID=A0A9J5XBU7_SOLCO|nr:hypothetical protein H5410_045513 [Solanum commersonii]
MAKIDNYEDSSAQATDDVESSEEKNDSGDEESSRDSRDTGDEDDDHLSLPICARGISVKYFKNKINLKKQSEVYSERGNASYALYAFLWAFLVWIYETFLHLGKYVKKSLDSPLPISHLLRWHTAKTIILSKVIHLITKNNLATSKSYVDEVKDIVLDELKANLKGVTILTSSVENVEDEY